MNMKRFNFYRVRYLMISLMFLASCVYVLCNIFFVSEDALHKYNESTNKTFRIDKKHYEAAGYKVSAKYYVFGTCLEDGKRYTIKVTPQCYMDMVIPSTVTFNISYNELEFSTGRYDYCDTILKHHPLCYSMLPTLLGIASLVFIIIFIMHQTLPSESGYKSHESGYAKVRKTYNIALFITWAVVLLNIGIWIKEIVISHF